MKFIATLLTTLVGLYTLALAGPTANDLKGKNKLLLIENKGQITDQQFRPRTDIDFYLRSKGVNVFVASTGLHYQFAKERKEGDKELFDMYRLDVEFVGANKNIAITTGQPLGYFERHYTAFSSEEGIMAKSYTSIVYHNVYDNIDWKVYLKDGGLKHEFIVKPGGRVSDIKLKYGGAKKLWLNESGNIVAETPQGNITEDAPLSYDERGVTVPSHFVLKGNKLSYSTAAYTGQLVIDPGLVWGTYHGGISNEAANDVVTDGSGNVYMVGATQSASGIATTGAYQTTLSGSSDAFIAKYTTSGTLLWATYYGGSGDDGAMSIAKDASGNICIAGQTSSTTGIATAGAYQTSFAGGTSLSLGDAFIAKFSSTGARLWATYYGGSSDEWTFGIATDAAGDMYACGYTTSTSGIATAGAHQTTHANPIDYDGYIVKFSNSGAMLWGTYYGGVNRDDFRNITTDATSNIYVTGSSSSTTNIATPGAHQTSPASYEDAILIKFNSSGTRIWGTYLGGNDGDFAYDVATDASGNVYIGGVTSSTSGLATPGAYQGTRAGTLDGFVMKMDNSGLLLWATYYGGNNLEQLNTVCTDAAGNVYVAGYTNSTTGLANSAGYHPTYYGGTFDGYFGKFNSSGAMQWSSYYGGTNTDKIIGIAMDASMNLYMCGQAFSPTDIATAGAHQTTLSGPQDAFLTVFDGTPSPGPISGTALICMGSTTTLAGTPPGGTWSSGWPSVATVGLTTGVVSGLAPGTATIYYHASSGLVSLVVTVNPTPFASAIYGVAALCVSGSTTLTHMTAGGVWTSSTPSVATIGASSGIVTPVSMGTTTISYATTNACGTAYSTRVVTVNSSPTAATISGTTTACLGGTTILTGSISGGTWTSGTPAIATVSSSGVVNGLTTGMAVISYTVTDACGTISTTVNVTVSTGPAPAVITGSTNVCVGDMIVLTAAPAGGTWISGTPATADVLSGIVSGIAAGTALISYIVSDGCGTATTIYTINVLAPALCTSLTGIQEKTSELIRVWPTPNNGDFNIEIHSVIANNEQAKIRICDITGRKVLETAVKINTRTAISLKSPGIYFVEVSSTSGKNVVRVLVE